MQAWDGYNIKSAHPLSLSLCDWLALRYVLKPWRVINKTNSNRNIIESIFQSGTASLQSTKRDIN